MRPETGRFLETAQDMLRRGERMLAADLVEDAGRAAYLAAFHAAQGLIFERKGRAVKTHRGVQTDFYRLIRDEPFMPADLHAFLSRAYGFKTITDYDPGTSLPPTREDARRGLDTAAQFVEEASRLIVR